MEPWLLVLIKPEYRISEYNEVAKLSGKKLYYKTQFDLSIKALGCNLSKGLIVAPVAPAILIRSIPKKTSSILDVSLGFRPA